KNKICLRLSRQRARSSHDDLVVETARSNNEKEGANGKERKAIQPKMAYAGAAQNHSTRDVDEIAGRDEVADDVEYFGHSFTRENIAGKKDAGQDRQKGELHGFGLRVRFAGDENTQ